MQRYCSPAINYGSIRDMAQRTLEEKTSEISDETAVMLALAAEASGLAEKVNCQR